MQATAAGDPQAIDDSEAYSEARSEATRRDVICRTKTSAVEHMGMAEAFPRRKRRREARGKTWLEPKPKLW
jgi:hypothetical protein